MRSATTRTVAFSISASDVAHLTIHRSMSTPWTSTPRRDDGRADRGGCDPTTRGMNSPAIEFSARCARRPCPTRRFDPVRCRSSIGAARLRRDVFWHPTTRALWHMPRDWGSVRPAYRQPPQRSGWLAADLPHLAPARELGGVQIPGSTPEPVLLDGELAAPRHRVAAMLGDRGRSGAQAQSLHNATRERARTGPAHARNASDRRAGGSRCRRGDVWRRTDSWRLGPASNTLTNVVMRHAE